MQSYGRPAGCSVSIGLALNPSPPRPLTQASHPPAGRRASCLVEGGDGAADGWEDDRNDKKESLWED